ncbi:MAG: hypothetical protein ABI294_06090 [Casimicrobiaceae bacterium]
MSALTIAIRRNEAYNSEVASLRITWIGVESNVFLQKMQDRNGNCKGLLTYDSNPGDQAPEHKRDGPIEARIERVGRTLQ